MSTFETAISREFISLYLRQITIASIVSIKMLIELYRIHPYKFCSSIHATKVARLILSTATYALIPIFSLHFILRRFEVLKYNDDSYTEMISFLVLMAPLYIYNGFFRYTENRYEQLEERWIDESNTVRTIRGVFVVATICSLPGLIFLEFFLSFKSK